VENFEPVIRENIAKIKTELEQLDTETIARQAGFLQRTERKLSVNNLLLALLALSTGVAPTLERIAAVSRLILGESYSKQALSKRINSGVDEFLAQVISRIFSDVKGRSVKGGAFASFNRVLLHDSTTIKLPGRFHSAFKGNSNRTKRKLALMKIQLVSDLLSERILHLSLSGFTRNDQAASGDIFSVARAGDLVLRDLGYFVVKSFKLMIDRNIFFLSRCRGGVMLLDPQTDKRIDLRKVLKKQGALDMDVLLSSTEKVPVRLVCCPVPEAVANERRRKAKTNRDKRHTPSKESLFLMGWSIFVTNVGRDVWNSKDFQPIYRLRWRIEIIFKAWKSHLKITELNVANEMMLRLSIMTKLLFCALTHHVCFALEILSPATLHVSLLRMARIFADCAILIAAIVLDVSPAELLSYLIKSHGFYERRSDRKNFSQLASVCALG